MTYETQVVIGLGTGRCGTQSLAHLLSHQRQACVTHERHAFEISWTGDQRRIDGVLEQLHREGDLCLVGDVAFYYLPYVEQILARYPDVKFVCLKRDRASTVASYMKKTEGRNHWIQHDGSRWYRDRWDHSYPKYPCADKEKAIGRYWDDYYRESERLQALYPEAFCVFPTEALNSKPRQSEILSFLGIPRRRHRRLPLVHLNAELTAPHRKAGWLGRLRSVFTRRAA